jgi:hypothetical protein
MPGIPEIEQGITEETEKMDLCSLCLLLFKCIGETRSVNHGRIFRLCLSPLGR